MNAARNNSNRCPSASVVAAFVEGGLPSGVRESYLSHLQGCRACADEVLDVREILADKSGILRTVGTVTPRRPMRVYRPARRATLPAWAYVAAASIVAALLGLAFLTDKGPTRSVSLPRTPQATPSVARSSETPRPVPPTETVAEKSSSQERAVAPAPTPVQPPSPPTTSQEPPEVAQRPPDRPARDAETQVPGAPAPSSDLQFSLAGVLGTMEVQQSGQTTWQMLKEGETTRVAGRVSVRAPANGAARVSFAGVTLSAERQSEVSIHHERGSYCLTLGHGGVLLDADAEAVQDDVVLEVAGAQVDARGTRCAVHLDGRQAHVTAIEGELPVTSAGRVLRLKEGYACVVSEGKTPQAARKADLNACLGWTREMEEYITVEAETGGPFQPLVRIGDDPKASGGHYVKSPRLGRVDDSIWVEVKLDVKRAGTWRIFGRLALGEYKLGRGGLRVSVDGGQPSYLPLRGATPGWRWSEMEDTVTLSPGRHTLRIMDPRGGHWIDCIMATTDRNYVVEDTQETPAAEPFEPRGGHSRGGTHKGR